MRRIVEVCVLLALALAGMPSSAMPLGARTLLHGHAVARQLAEVAPPPQIWTVTFDANGGVLIGEDESGGLGSGRPTSVTNGCSMGELPVAIRTDYIFEGWFTAADDGEQVTPETVINSDMTLYAHWQCRFAFGDGDDWTQLPDGSWKSGATADGATNSLSMTVNGAGVVSFRWKTSCEDYFNFKGMLLRQDGLSFRVDGEERGFTNGIMSGWAECSFEVDGAGSHTFTWSYIKDVSGLEGEDCAWVDAVAWTPAGITIDMGGGKSVTVPQTWIEAHENLVRNNGGSVSAALQATAANGRMSVAECYVVGVDPESTTNDFKITSFPLKADGTPDLENIVFDPPEAKWNVEGARPVVKGTASLDGEWQAVTEENKAGFRFFKVEVVLP